MSNPDSFIQEVTEEVQRDRMFGLFKRYGWIAGLLIVVIVGGAAYLEWQKAQTRMRAQSFGDALLAAFSLEDVKARTEAVNAITPLGEGQALVLDLVRAAEAAERDDPAQAAAAWIALSKKEEVPEVYQHLALLKAHYAGGSGDAGADTRALERLATPGAPFRPLAIEQQALAALKTGDRAVAIEKLREAAEAPGATEILRQRTSQLIVALGANLDPA